MKDPFNKLAFDFSTASSSDYYPPWGRHRRLLEEYAVAWNP